MRTTALLDGAESVDRLKKSHAKHVDVRNAIAHISCVGRLKSDPKRVVFSSVKRVKGTVGHTMIESIHLDQMVAAVTFALDACQNIAKIIAVLDAPISETGT